MAASGAAGTARSSSYGSGARVLAVGIASTGLFTFAYFAVADQVLGDTDYGAISLLWSILFVALSVLYRPVEQLLSRTIADRRARGATTGHPLRTAVLLQAGFALAFLALALALRGPLLDAFGSEALWWVFVGAAVAYAASYFARGYFAGHGWFALYGGLVLFESVGRFCFPLAVAVGLATGELAVALGILAAPLLSLLVVPVAIARHARRADEAPAAAVAAPATGLRTAGGFAVGVALVQLGEQALLNAAVLTVAATASTALAGVVFNALLIVRAPLQLFQAVQTSLLPHLAGAAAGEDHAEFVRAVRTTVLAIAAFAGAVALGLLAVGPWAMDLLFGREAYGRFGLAAIGVGMGFHLAAGTLNQAVLARGHAGRAAACWLTAAAAFVLWMLLAPVDDQLVRTEVGYLGAAVLLCGLMAGAVRR